MPRIDVSAVKWGKYDVYEGPVHFGSMAWPTISASAPFADKALAVIVATEGPPDCINMYDSQRLSLGPVQFGFLANRGASKFVDNVLRHSSQWIQFQNYLLSIGYVFLGGDFVHHESGKQVVDNESACEMLFGGGDGRVDSWNGERVDHAMMFCAEIASLWEPQLISQAWAYGKETMPRYLMPEPKRYWFGLNTPLELDIDLVTWEICKALLLSYTTNNSVWTRDAATSALRKWKPNQNDLVTILARTLACHPRIPLFRTRHNKIRPVIQRLWGVDIGALP